MIQANRMQTISTHQNQEGIYLDNTIPVASMSIDNNQPNADSIHLSADLLHDHDSLRVQNVPFVVPQQLLEESLEEDSPGCNGLLDSSFRMHLVEGGSRKGKARLIDSLGYAYTLKCSKSESHYWSCPKRGKGFRCPATVIQKGETFFRGNNVHNHAPKAGSLVTTKVHATIRKKASNEMYQSASSIVHDALRKNLKDRPTSDLPTIQTLIRITNRKRQGNRPVDPVDLSFTLATDHVPVGFFQSDVMVGDKRHLIFATDEQIALLSKAKRWYMDGTFRVVKHPFTQLFSLHAFVKHEESIKQVPLAFILMSGKRKDDYAAVLKSILDLCSVTKVKSFVVDFEAGLWQALREVFPGFPIQGCVFHWTQAVWRKVQSVGLQTAYTDDNVTHTYIRKLLALPFLPEEHIQPVFEKLLEKAEVDQRLIDVVAYIRSTWIVSELWPPSTWTVFMQAVRTNNDVEGWHERLNRRSHIPLYLLITLLHREALLVNLQVKLVKVKKLSRLQRAKYVEVQGRLEDMWEKYCRGEKSASKLLRSCARVYDPVIDA